MIRTSYNKMKVEMALKEVYYDLATLYESDDTHFLAVYRSGDGYSMDRVVLEDDQIIIQKF